ncbi:MAG: hypothetical protein AAFR94_06135, partial [Pseudomonadota bacterium]
MLEPLCDPLKPLYVLTRAGQLLLKAVNLAKRCLGLFLAVGAVGPLHLLQIPGRALLKMADPKLHL